MNNEDIRRLIGGYATGTLTEEERRILFEAALEDQELFDALQQEQPLKELFDDAFSREQVRRAAAATLPTRRSAWFRRPAWFRQPPWFRQPWIWALGASVAASSVVTVGLVKWSHWSAPVAGIAARETKPAAAPVAENRPPAPAPPPSKSAPPRRAAKKAERPAARLAHAQQPGGVHEQPQIAQAAPPPPPPQAQAPTAPAQAPQNETQPQQDAGARDQALEKDQTKQQAAATGSTESVEVTSQAAQPQPREAEAAAPRPTPPAAFMRRSPPRMKAKSTLTASKAFAASSPSVTYLVEIRLEDGNYVNAPVNAAFTPGTILRLTISPRIEGITVVYESDSANPEFRRLFPPDQENAQLKPFANFTVPVDIAVKKGERLRVVIGSSATEIPIRTADAK